jgi:CBS domain-containing protein/PII-like signaling protein
MQMQGKAQRVSIYIGEDNHYQGQSLYMALLEFLRRENASGATVTRGLAGFGAHSRIHTAAIITLSTDLPIKIEWIDVPEVVDRLLPQVRRMVDDGLITVEEVEVVQYAPGRAPDPLAQPVHDFMRSDVLTARPETPITDIVSLLLKRGYHSLPVVEADGHLVGLVTDGDLLRRAGLQARLDLQPELSITQFHQQLETLLSRNERALDIMTHPVVTVRHTDSLRQAVERMAEPGLKRLPVVDEQGRLVGLISRIDVLRAVEYHQAGKEKEEELHHGTTVAELMYTDVPTVDSRAHLEEIVRALESSQRRRAIVVDGERHVLGIISDGDLLRRSRQGHHPALIRRLRRLITGEKGTGSPLPAASETAATLMTAPVITITVNTLLSEALHLMVQHGIKRLPVVDDDGHLVGLLGRASVLRGILATGEA